MKYLVVLVTVIWIMSCVPQLRTIDFVQNAKPVYINEYVGDRIDAIERQTYDLFPDIDSFVFADLYKHPSGGYHWKIQINNEKYIASNKNPQAAQILTDYIVRHEEAIWSKTDFERTWNIVAYDMLGQPITQYEVYNTKTLLQKQKSSMVMGSACIGCCLGGTLGFFIGYLISDEPEDTTTSYWEDVLPWSNNSSLSHEAGTGAWIGAAAGTAIGMGITILGARADIDEAIKIIKAARMPHRITQ